MLNNFRRVISTNTDYLINESLNFNDNQGTPNQTSKEILDLVRKAFPKKILDSVSEIEPNHNSNMICPPSVKIKGAGYGSIDYKSIILIFDKPIGKSKIDSLTIGIRKRTSGPNTGYLAIKGTKDNGSILMETVPNNSVSIEFYDNAEEMLKKLFDEELTKYI